MKTPLFWIALTFLTISFVTVGCQTRAKEVPEPPVTDKREMEIRLAPIEEVRVRIAESYPPQIFVSIRGGLSDACTTPHEVKVARSGNTINIEVTTQRPRDAICAQVYSTFEKNVALGSDFTPGKTYTINVNDAKPVTFTLP
ncbi:MAG: hypothetical protein HY663_04045 [Chloroflexi bacterium]|nr:hypothetical protein [Chloroflexota bacterium]